MTPTLKELLGSVTGGIWIHATDIGQIGSVETTDGKMIAQTQQNAPMDKAQRDINAAYIARVGPQTMALVLSALEEAERYLWNSPLEGALVAHAKVQSAIENLNGTALNKP